jgi:alkylation response protein AidB-like acyl-CoA dehydrogenase
MNFELNEAQKEYRQRVIDFATAELEDAVVDNDRESRFPAENWSRCAEFGIQSLSLPEQYTGYTDRDFLTAIIAMEALGYACADNGLTFALNAQIWTVQLPIFQFGSEEQRSRYLPRLSSGEWIGCHAISEPESGSDVFNMTTVAVRADDGYILTGKKHYISLAPVADLALVFALTDPTAGKWGVSGFLVETASPGVAVGENRPKMGLRTVPFSDIEFRDCFVPEANRLGPEGAGMSLSTS